MNKQSIISRLKNDNRVVTHFGNDLDNTASIEALRRETGLDLDVERVPAGQFKEGSINIDTGGHRGIWEDGETVVIDGNPERGIKSTVMQLSLLGFEIPPPLVELTDSNFTGIDIFDPRYGRNLVKYLPSYKLFEFAEKGFLTKSLSDKELEEYGLIEVFHSQKETIRRAAEEIEHYRSGDAVVAEKYIPMGATVAYALGCRYYASISPHRGAKGVTFAITSKPGIRLPDAVLEWGRQLSREHSFDENTSSIYVDPMGSMIIAGGHKNPEFSLPWTVNGTSGKIKEMLGLRGLMCPFSRCLLQPVKEV